MLIVLSLLDDKCQFWLNDSSKILTSPYLNGSKHHFYQPYYNNLNCTWMLKAEQGYYVNLEIDFFWVNKNSNSKMISMVFLNDNHCSLILETTCRYLMEEICNLNRFENWIEIPITKR